ncbi:MAG: PAS domain S-box protein [Halobacteria archaeon]|nr:PAS domain S-box protein [Halobacteria archaeon]
MTETDTTRSEKSGRINKLVYAGLLLPMALLVLIVGYFLAKGWQEDRIEEMLHYDDTQLQLVSGFLGAEVILSLKHLHSISTELFTLQALDSPEPKQLRILESSFLTLARRNPLYQQIRWIDASGIERARIMRDRGEPFVVEPRDLQDKSDRYYFKAANAMLPGELYISRIDLNEEHGQMEMPPKPMLRIATPVANSEQKRRGIIVINIEMKYLFEFIRTRKQADLEVEYLLVNQEGVLLNASTENALTMEGEEPGMDFSALHPDVWETVSARDVGNLESTDGLWTWRKLSPVNTFKKLNLVFPQHMIAFDQMISDDFSLSLIAHRPIETMEAMRRENLMLITLGSIFILSVYAITLFFYLSGTARARRAEIEAAYARERVASMGRMKELEQRFHRLVDASSIGQLVVDSDGRIEISNLAAERVLGYERGELEGVLVDTMLPADLREQHVHHREQYLQEPEARMMGTGRELKAVRKEGSTIPVEVGLTPYTDQDRQLILVSIIDLSHRDSAGRSR